MAILKLLAGKNQALLVRQNAILKLLSSEDEMLLIRGDAFFVLNFGFHVVDGTAILEQR